MENKYVKEMDRVEVEIVSFVFLYPGNLFHRMVA